MPLRFLLAAFATAAILVPAESFAATTVVDTSLYSSLRWRQIGPWRGGRATAATGVRGEPRLFYMGACGGGVWKTDDAGASWKCLSDSTFGTGSVGAIAVAPSDRNVIYVGMGESPIRGNVSHGDGVYRSTDAGATWHRAGLERTFHIARVRVHPNDPDLVYAAALGRVFGPSPERGIFRSRDGGRSWQRVLFVNDSTGASDLVMDPTNPRILYAGFWQVHRRPWTLESGGPGSSLWKSTDGGDTWKKLTGDPDNGLPKGVLGKITVTVSPVRPERAWAMIEAAEGGLFRTDDGGRSWTRVNDERKLRQRAWYFSRCYADTRDPDQVYVLNVAFHVSKDGGRTFRNLSVPHGDNHDLWIDPDDPLRMIESNDGGATVTLDGGRSWSSVENQPTAQFYRIAIDDQFPYRLYGSQQDNSSVSIPSRTTGYGIEREDWYDVGGGESGWIAPKPGNPDVIYAGSYDGYLTRLDRKTQQQRDINVYPDNPMGSGAEGARYRFQWNFPILASKHDPSVLYCAANVMFKTRDEGQTWEAISPDLTRNDPSKQGPSGGPITKDNTSVEYYCTIFAVAESPKDAKVLWVGSDDGVVHVTRDGGVTWKKVTPQGLPEWAQINAIDASPHDPATAYVAAVAYKMNDFRPYAYVTHDGGRSWKKITTGVPDGSFIRVVREDPVRKGLLYAGTETGMWVSFDDGAHWQGLRLGLPTVPVTDAIIAGDDLAISTQGRGFWILDDLGVVRALSPGAPKTAVRLYAPSRVTRIAGASVPRTDAGSNPPIGARIRWWMEKAPADSVPVALEILDASGTLLRRFDRRGEVVADTSLGRKDEGPKVPVKAGLNEFVWDLRSRSATRFDGIILWGGELDGPIVVPGKYQARLTTGARTETQTFDVVRDPRLTTTDDDFRAQWALLTKIRDKLTEMHDAIGGIREAREQIDATVTRAKRAGKESAVSDSAKALKKRLSAIEEALYQTKSKSNQDPLNFPIRLNNKLALLAGTVASADARPTAQSQAVYDDLIAKIDAQFGKLRTALGADLDAFNRLASEKGVPAVAVRKWSAAAH